MKKAKASILLSLLLICVSANSYYQAKFSNTALGIWLTVFITALSIIILVTIVNAIFKHKK